MRSQLALVWALGGFLLVGSSTTPVSAAAIAGKVCNVVYRSVSDGHGTDGYLTINFSTGPGCTGTASPQYYLCSPGATSTDCVATTDDRYTALALSSTAEMLARAADTDQSVDYAILSCLGGGTNGCLRWVRFRAN